MGVLGLSFALCVVVFYLRRAQWVGRRGAEQGRRGRYRGGAALGNALQTLHAFVHPQVEHAIEMKLDEAVDEDDEGEPRNPRAHLLRQAKRIRNGETVDRLTTLLPP
jgi:hypothetical protein